MTSVIIRYACFRLLAIVFERFSQSITTNHLTSFMTAIACAANSFNHFTYLLKSVHAVFVYLKACSKDIKFVWSKNKSINYLYIFLSILNPTRALKGACQFQISSNDFRFEVKTRMFIWDRRAIS